MVIISVRRTVNHKVLYLGDEIHCYRFQDARTATHTLQTRGYTCSVRVPQNGAGLAIPREPAVVTVDRVLWALSDSRPGPVILHFAQLSDELRERGLLRDTAHGREQQGAVGGRQVQHADK